MKKTKTTTRESQTPFAERLPKNPETANTTKQGEPLYDTPGRIIEVDRLDRVEDKTNYFDRVHFPGGGTRAPIVREGKFEASYDLICPAALKELAMVYQEGEEKYPHEDNRIKGSTYVRGLPFDNTIRHIMNHIEIARKGGDAEGPPHVHLAKAAWGCFSLIHFLKQCKHHRITHQLDRMVKAGWDGDFGKVVK